MSADIKRLRSVIAVAEHGSFGRAAGALRISQPALSTHVAQVERDLGISLFSRTTRAVRLTAAGESFVWRARRIIEELESALLDVREQATIARGRLTVAATPTVAAHVLPPAVQEFARRFPAVSVQIFDDVSSSVERLVSTGAADFGIGPSPAERTALDFKPLVQDDFIAIMPRRHPLAERGSVSLREVLEYPVLTLRPGTNIRSAIERAIPGLARTFRPAFEVHNHYTALGLVRAGLGTAILPAMVTQNLGERAHYAIAQITRPTIRRVIGFIFRRGERLQPSARAFHDVFRTIEDLRSQARELRMPRTPASGAGEA
jgi:LysR family carnitine catabolism transcriptional activator